MKTAVVLSGGGAKGAYQLGVWKALRKMHIKYNIVTGTSVGALNGILMVQNSYFAANKIWKNISYNDIYGDSVMPDNVTNQEIYKTYIKKFIEDGGMSTSSLEKLFGKYIKLWRFKLSKTDFGMVTFNITTMKPLELTKKDLIDKSLKDYALASSSCYPAFKTKTIENQSYIDGGYYDNLPINLAIKMGADRVIAIDLRAPGIKKNITDKSVEIIKIYPRNKIVSFLVFDKELSKKALCFGYNDAMKNFGKLDGNKYTFRKNDLSKNYSKYRDNMIAITKKISENDNVILKSIMAFNDINTILNQHNFLKLHNDIIEYLGKTFELDESILYNINSFNSELLYDFENLGKISRLTERAMLDSKLVIAYIYNMLNTQPLNSKKIGRFMLMFKKEFMAALYLTAIERS